MPANFNSLSTYGGRIAARSIMLILPIGSCLWMCVATYAVEPPALPQTGLTPKPNLVVGTGFASASPALATQASAPGVPLTIDNNGMANLDDRRGLSVGDHLFFRIIEDNDDPRQLTITDSGEVEVPYVGRVQVRGMTCKQLATELKKSLEAKFYYRATVIISVDAMSKVLGKVYTSGALRTPGRLEIPGNEVFTLSKAILCAGGFADYADKHNVKVTRRSESKATNELFTVDVGQILERGKTELDLPLEPGDMIFVPERLNIF